MEKEEGRERVRRREYIGEEERNSGRESVRRRGSSYYKWQSLPGAYDKGFSILQGIETPQRTPQLLSQWEGQPAINLVTTLHH